jgi:glutathione S-transferase
MALQLYSHPLSSYCHKVLIALYESGTSFENKLINPGSQTEREAFLRLWPTGKIPLLVDDGHVVPETTIMIEHIQRRHAPAVQLLPSDPDMRLEVRLWDRLFDNYVMTPVQAIVAQQLREASARDPLAAADARTTLTMAYGMIEQHLRDGREWIAGSNFSAADCAATPSLFYASTLVPFADNQQHLKAYFERLVARPSARRVLEEARPWFKYYPFSEAIPARFMTGDRSITGSA